MITYEIDSNDLLKWGRYLNEIPRKTAPALARGLNAIGELWVRSMAVNLADYTGLEAGAIMNLTVVHKATPGHLEYDADATAVVTASPDWLRPWAERDKSTFEQDTLVKIITVGDHHDCEVCAEIAENSPYTMGEVKKMQERWAHWHAANGPAPGERTNLVHPNCRCTIQPWTSARRLPVAFKGKGMPPELMNARQLGERVAEELKIAIRVR
jgi:hypothetical protein